MRIRRSVSILLLVLAVLTAVALRLSPVRANDPASSKSHVMVATPPSQPSKAHVLYAALWRTDGSFVSTIRIKNVLVVAPLQVTPTLFMADGTAYPLPTLTLPMSGVATININDALAAAPQSVAPHISQFGSATILYSYPSPGHLIASIAAISVSRSLSFMYPVIEPMPMPNDNSQQILEGLWWKHDSGVKGILSLSNTTDQERTVTLRSIRQAGDGDLHEVQLAPRTTQLLELEEVSRDTSDPHNTAGGIRVEYPGPGEAVLVTGSLANETEGYSANIPFWSHDMTSSSAGNMTTASARPTGRISMAAAGLMIGKPDPMMMPGFPADTTFTPYLVLRNTTAEPMDVGLQLNYMAVTESGAATNRDLPAQRLRPFEAKQIELKPLLDSVGLKSFSGTINLAVSFNGQSGDLVIASGSVDQTGTYVFEVPPQAFPQPSPRKTANYWSVAEGNDTMFTLWNSTDRPEDSVFTLFYSDGKGQYTMPLHLAPQASTMIDVGMLIREKTPDSKGHIIPPNIQEGSAGIANANDHAFTSLVMAGGTYNVINATCGTDCLQNCCAIMYSQLSPASPTININGSVQLSAVGTDCNGYPAYPPVIQWSTSDSNIASVDAYGDITGVAPGQATITAYFAPFNNNYTGTVCSPATCPTYDVPPVSTTVTVSTPTATITVKFSSSKSPGDNLTFGTASCSENLGGPLVCNNASVPGWFWNVEVSAVVNDDASKWAVTQTIESKRGKGYYTYQGVLHAFDTGVTSVPCPPCDGPDAQYLQQTSGQKNIFYLDGPGPFMTYATYGPVDSETFAENFTAHFCSTLVANTCYTQQWYVKIVVDPGAFLDVGQSSAGLGTTSTTF